MYIITERLFVHSNVCHNVCVRVFVFCIHKICILVHQIDTTQRNTNSVFYYRKKSRVQHAFDLIHVILFSYVYTVSVEPSTNIFQFKIKLQFFLCAQYTCTQESLIFPQFIFLVIEMMIDFINIALKYNVQFINFI